MKEYDNSLRIDKDARSKIVRNIDTNYFVSASAGSGKTTSLVARMVSMVISGIDVSKICTITFTKAAANEFYSRFQKLLSEMCNPITNDSSRSAKELLSIYQDDNGELPLICRSRCFEALQNIDLCFMGTIDAFCNMIISEHPMEANVPASAKILEDEELNKFYYDEYKKIDSGYYNDIDPNLQNEFVEICSLQSQPKKSFACIMQDFMNHRNFNIIIEEFNLAFNNYITKEDRDYVISLAKYLVKNKEYIAKDTIDATNACEKFLTHKNIFKSNWANNTYNIKKYLDEIKKLHFDSNIEVSDVYSLDKIRNNINLQFSKDVKAKIDAIIYKIKYYVYLKSANFYKKCVPIIENELRKNGAFNFFDYLYYLSDMLERDSKKGGLLIKHIQNRHRYFLIDEFQDTDPLQSKIFFYLAANKIDPDWRKCIPNKGSLFIVGDDKQSIYHFKGADVLAFINIKNIFSNPDVGEVLLMTQNFRSTIYLKQWFNETFKEMFKNPTGTQCEFLPIPLKFNEDEEDIKPVVMEKGKYLTKVYKYASQKGEDPQIVSKMIKELVDNPKVLMPRPVDKKTGIRPKETLNYNDFMVITSNKTHMTEYINAFVENKIPFMIEGKTAFNNCKILCVLTAILYSFVYQDYPDNVYSSLSTDGLNYSKNRILKFRNGESDKELEEVYNILNELYMASKKYSVSVVFDLALSKLKLFRDVSSEYAEYIFFTLELLRSAENEGSIVTYQEGVDYLNTLVYGESGLERCIALTKGENRVHIANLHKVKGLEAPVVILASPSAKKHPNNAHIDRTNGNNDCYFIKVSEQTGEIKPNYLENPLYSSKGGLVDIESNYCDEEKKRLVYVAATRAQRILLVSYIEKTSYWKELIENISDEDEFSNSGLVGEEKEFTQDVVNADSLYEEAKDDLIDFTKEELNKKTYHIIKPSQVKVDNKINMKDTIVSTSTLSQTEAMTQGTMVHKLLESLVNSNNKYDIDELVDEINRDYPNEIPNIKDKLVAVARTMNSGGYIQENGYYQDIFKELKDASEVITELPFCYKENNNIIHGVMDLVYKKDNKWYIIDYKTNAEKTELDLHYKGQLDTYKKAFLDLTGEESEAFIYHIDL